MGRVNVGLEQELEKYVQDTARRTGKTTTEVVRELVEKQKKYEDDGHSPIITEKKEKILKSGGTVRHVDRHRFGLRGWYVPVGNVFCWGAYKLIDISKASIEMPLHTYTPTKGYEHMAYSSPWWCPQEKINDIKLRVEELKGFELIVGEGGGFKDYPMTITTEEDERKINGRWHINTKGVPALIGDILVWLEINDVDKANETLYKRSDIPCYIKCDIDKYNSNKFYQEVFEKANHYFMYYYINEKPYNLTKAGTVEEIYKSL